MELLLCHRVKNNNAGCVGLKSAKVSVSRRMRHKRRRSHLHHQPTPLKDALFGEQEAKDACRVLGRRYTLLCLL